MLSSPRRPANRKIKDRAFVFAALGDETRLMIVRKLCAGEVLSISQLTEGTKLSRQAVTKHLRLLEQAGVVRCSRNGRETLFRFEPEPIQDTRDYLASVSDQWDKALARLKSFVESDPAK